MMQYLHIVSVGAAGLWLLAGALRGFLPLDQRAPAMWVLIFTGVPLLGWLTMNWGPTAGLAACAVGAAVLMRAPRRVPGPPSAPPSGQQAQPGMPAAE